MYQTSRFVWQA